VKGSAALVVCRHALQGFAIDPFHGTLHQAEIDFAGQSVNEIESWEAAYAIDQKGEVLLGRCCGRAGIDVGRVLRMHVDVLVSGDVQHAANIEDVHFARPPEGDGARDASARDVIVQELEMQAGIGGEGAAEQDFLHPREGFDVVREQVVDGLVAADLEAAAPGSLDEQGRTPLVTRAG
jgi:hypothetical protein